MRADVCGSSTSHHLGGAGSGLRMPGTHRQNRYPDFKQERRTAMEQVETPETMTDEVDGPIYKCSICDVPHFDSEVQFEKHMKSQEHFIKSNAKSKVKTSIVLTYSKKEVSDTLETVTNFPTVGLNSDQTSRDSAACVSEMADHGTGAGTFVQQVDKGDTIADNTLDKREISGAGQLTEDGTSTNGDDKTAAIQREEKKQQEKASCPEKHAKNVIPVKCDKKPLKKTVKENLSCQECDMEFSGPIPYMQHMKSTTHEKQLRKKTFQDKLSKALKEDQDIVPFDSNTGYYCKLCLTAFSGEQGAYEHLIGKNHARVKLRQKMLEEIKVSLGNVGEETDGLAELLSQMHISDEENDTE